MLRSVSCIAAFRTVCIFELAALAACDVEEARQASSAPNELRAEMSTAAIDDFITVPSVVAVRDAARAIDAAIATMTREKHDCGAVAYADSSRVIRKVERPLRSAVGSGTITVYYDGAGKTLLESDVLEAACFGSETRVYYQHGESQPFWYLTKTHGAHGMCDASVEISSAPSERSSASSWVAVDAATQLAAACEGH